MKVQWQVNLWASWSERTAIVYIVNYCFEVFFLVIVACHGTIHGIKLIEIKMTELEKLLKSDKGVRAKFAKHEAKSAIRRALRIACPVNIDCCLDDGCLKAIKSKECKYHPLQ